MAVIRFLAALFILVAVVALVADLTPATSGTGSFVPRSLARHWTDAAPASLTAAKAAVAKHAHPLVWDRLVAPLINLPVFVLFGLLGAALGYLGRRRRSTNVFTN